MYRDKETGIFRYDASAPGWPPTQVVVRIFRMTADVENGTLNNCDSAELLGQSGTKAVRLLEQLMTEQVQIEQTSLRVSDEAMNHCRVAMAQTIAALRLTIQTLRDAADKPIQ